MIICANCFLDEIGLSAICVSPSDAVAGSVIVAFPRHTRLLLKLYILL